MSGLTAAEYATAVRHAHAECAQEIAAAADEYNQARRPIAARRKDRAHTARAKRDERLRTLRLELGAKALEGTGDESGTGQ